MEGSPPSERVAAARSDNDREKVYYGVGMTNGNIDQFVKAHLDTNRFKLVSFLSKFPSPSLLVNDYVIP